MTYFNQSEYIILASATGHIFMNDQEECSIYVNFFLRFNFLLSFDRHKLGLEHVISLCIDPFLAGYEQLYQPRQ